MSSPLGRWMRGAWSLAALSAWTVTAEGAFVGTDPNPSFGGRSWVWAGETNVAPVAEGAKRVVTGMTRPREWSAGGTAAVLVPSDLGGNTGTVRPTSVSTIVSDSVSSHWNDPRWFAPPVQPQ